MVYFAIVWASFMRNDQIFVLLLVILLPMTGCFDGAVGDAEGTDDTSENDASENGDSTGGEGTSIGTDTSTQARTWYSSGGVYQTFWDDGQHSGQTNSSNGSSGNFYISNYGQRCLAWGPYYDSSTGELLGERCNEWGYPESPSDWNLTDCTDSGGEIVWNYNVEDNPYYYRYAPTCKMTFATINSTVGEALLIYEWSGFSIAATCDGVNVYTSSSALSGKNYVIVPGTALECSHEIYQTLQYTYQEYQFESQSIWSIVYAIQDTTVV